MSYNKLILFALAIYSTSLCAHDVSVPKTIENYSFEPVSSHIHILHGPLTHPTPENRGFMNNPGMIVTGKGIIIVDPGSSRDIGKQVVAKARKVSDKPVIAVINTHIHGDHWLGNDGIRELYPDVPIYAHEKMIERAQAEEGKFWVDVFNKMTKGTAGETRDIVPNIGVKGGETLKFDDISLRIHYAGHAHSDSDIFIEVINDKGLFCGDVVVAKHVPNSDVPQDASFKGSIEAIKNILKGSYSHFIPGHGPSGGREVPEQMLVFHEKLYGLVKRFYQEGMQDYEMKDRIIDEMAEYKDWHNFNEMGRVVGYVYREIESDSF